MTTLSSRYATLFVLALSLALWGCPHKGRPPVLAGTPGGAGSGSSSSPAPTPPAQPVDEGPDVRAVEGEGASGSDLAYRSAGGDASEGGPLADIHFELDSAALTEADRATLAAHAQWLASHLEARVTVEGHCDERGTVEYNLALGEQRARAARDYLVSLGIAAERLSTVSYGKERPLDTGTTEDAFARNRRAHFVVRR
jgi:peptidoglycan-associated lipoprotein